MKKNLCDEALACGKERRSKMKLVHPDGTPRTKANLDSAEIGFAAERQRVIDEGYIQATTWEDKVLKIDYWDALGNPRQHKRATFEKAGLAISGVGSVADVQNKIPDEMLFDVSYSDGKVYKPLWEGIPGSVVKEIVQDENLDWEFGSNYDGSGLYLVIKKTAIPIQYRYKR